MRMNAIDPGLRHGWAWLAGAILAAIIGGAVTVYFATWWFAEVGGHCGFVRAYEQLFGAFIIGGWLAGTFIGLVIAFIGRCKRSRGLVVGSLIAILTNVVAVAACALTVHEVRGADYTLKTTEELLDLLAGEYLDARILSAHALGERRTVEALPSLCAILDDAGADINLRHNVATALGRICAPPRQPGADVDRALTSLSTALKDRDEYLPHSIAKAMGDIGDARAVAPLADFLVDGARPIHAREEVARALGRIGGIEAKAALEKALPGITDESLTQTIKSAVKAANKPADAEKMP